VNSLNVIRTASFQVFLLLNLWVTIVSKQGTITIVNYSLMATIRPIKLAGINAVVKLSAHRILYTLVGISEEEEGRGDVHIVVPSAQFDLYVDLKHFISKTYKTYLIGTISVFLLYLGFRTAPQHFKNKS